LARYFCAELGGRASGPASKLRGRGWGWVPLPPPLSFERSQSNPPEGHLAPGEDFRIGEKWGSKKKKNTRLQQVLQVEGFPVPDGSAPPLFPDTRSMRVQMRHCVLWRPSGETWESRMQAQVPSSSPRCCRGPMDGWRFGQCTISSRGSNTRSAGSGTGRGPGVQGPRGAEALGDRQGSPTRRAGDDASHGD
jgi:hypothetical protein